MWKTSFAVLALVLVLGGCSSKKDSATDSTSTTGAGGVGSGIDRGAVGPGTQADLVANVGDRVFFELDRSDITQEGRATLGRQAEWLKKYSNVSITIEGHADERGTREYNLALGERRATAVKNYLVANGIPSSRIQTVSFGKERPAVLGSDEASWAQNRRGVTVVGGPSS
ncbi:peptidoglycan-associated lipoprotein Pal [Roseiterribacter gracilis]|uniref:Peptidoglycan-associated lipoprotein n=1 Tax=Roseiterribacter gracilis TaxID=2812848 RepID=A0A8S8XGC2_9PROT|nr:peptidoglycan-associated lipoprotein [Rhodospirillales bacterium TMPK1]